MQNIINDFIEELDALIRGDVDSISTVIPLGLAVEQLEKREFNMSNDIETNGWQADYWTSAELDGGYYNIDGSMYYGNFNISKSISMAMIKKYVNDNYNDDKFIKKAIGVAEDILNYIKSGDEAIFPIAEVHDEILFILKKCGMTYKAYEDNLYFFV